MGKKRELMMMPPCPVKQRMIDYCEGTEEAKWLSFDYNLTHDFEVNWHYKGKIRYWQRHEIRISHDGIPVRHFSGSSLEAVWEKFVNFVEEIKTCSNKIVKIPEPFCDERVRAFHKFQGIVIDAGPTPGGGFWFCLGRTQNKITVTEQSMPSWIVIGAIVEVDFENGVIELVTNDLP
jgi:hypothetical protein